MQSDPREPSKDIDFSLSGIIQRWDAGYRHAKAELARKPWVGEFRSASGVVLNELFEFILKRLSKLAPCHARTRTNSLAKLLQPLSRITT